MSYTYSNTSKATGFQEALNLGMNTNYAKVTDEPTMARVSNKTASLEQPEIITYRSEPISNVSTSIKVRNPLPVKDGVMYVIKLETVNRVTSGTDTFDEPFSCWLSIKHPLTNTWTNSAVADQVQRLLSACLKGLTTGTPATALTSSNYRFEDLQRSALVPTAD